MKKINLIKRGITILTMGAIIVSSSVPVYARKLPRSIKQEKKIYASPLWVYSYEETVTKYYNTATEIPSSIYYEYYHDTAGWMRGTLYYKSHSKDGRRYVATFKGTMYSNSL